ncbi:MAG: sensor histidine kinase [Bacteroidota bacterium]
MSASLIIIFSFTYLGLLFGIAYAAEKTGRGQRLMAQNPYMYAFSLAVYCTAWTFYGSVGRASTDGIGFLPIYIGPTLMAPLWYIILRKFIAISKSQRITSIADFISSRYGKSVFLGALVTIISVFGVIPYIALQLKAISLSFNIMMEQMTELETSFSSGVDFYQDTAFYITIILAWFTILFGARHLEATEQHEGLVAAVAFESLVKLVAFLAVGIFVTFFLYNGPSDLFLKAASRPELSRLFTIDSLGGGSTNWFFLTMISMSAVIFLPRQFHISVVENVDIRHLNKAIWLFPLYMFIINLFVLPIAVGGGLEFEGMGIEADTYVLALPLDANQGWLAMLVFLGGLSAATSMVIVATIALSIMISNNLVVPFLLRTSIVRENFVQDISSRLIGIRRLSITIVLLLAYSYFRSIGQNYSLVSIGLISFVAVAQFAPAAILGVFWRGGTKAGAITALLTGFLMWGYTLPLPSLAEVGILNDDFIEHGLFGIEALKPYQFMGVTSLDRISHAAFWSLLLNLTAYLVVSLLTKQSALEHAQSSLFVNISRYVEDQSESRVWRGKAYLHDIQLLLNRFLGKSRADKLLRSYARRHKIDLEKLIEADAALVNYAERLLAGAIGAASSRLLIASVVKEEPLSIKEVMTVLDETQQLVRYSRAIEKKSQELERTSRELQSANLRLKEMDRLKDDFITTVTHELRTPMTSIKALSSILYENEEMDVAKRREFLQIITQECERITRLINQVLDLEKMESGHAEWKMASLDLAHVVEHSIKGLKQLCNERGIQVVKLVEPQLPTLMGDKDRLMQVVVNLLSNAIKFCPSENGVIMVSLRKSGEYIVLKVKDNGVGISPEEQTYIFNKFTQFNDYKSGRPQGSGLGLSISWRIVVHHGGTIRVESEKGRGATFIVSLPIPNLKELPEREQAVTAH